MNLVFVTRDVGNGNALKPVAQLALASGHEVDTFFGEGKPFSAETVAQMPMAVADADRLIVSLSSSEERVATERLATELAVRHGVPIVIVSDIYGMIHRSQWLGGFARHADLLTVVSESEVTSTESYVQPITTVVALPNPSWIDYFSDPSETGVREKLGIRDNDMMVLVVGNKELVRNRKLLHALQSVTNKDPFVHFVITSHPGADHTMDQLGFFGQSESNATFVPKGGMSSFSILSASDLVITSGGSSMTMMAACRRIPVIDLMHDEDFRLWKELSGLDYWPPAQEGVSALVEDSNALGFAIEALLDEESVASQVMRHAQDRGFKREMFAGAARDILSAIEAL